MPNPWDAPPLPQTGDTDPEKTFAGVGRVISQWELVEVELSWLNKQFAGVPVFDLAPLRAYGEGTIFKMRLTGLEKSAEAFFRRYPNQELEGIFCQIVVEARGCGDRRGEVAHGAVMPFQYAVPWNPKTDPTASFQPMFCVVPPHYTGKKFDESQSPKYAYTSVELRELEILFTGMRHRIFHFWHAIRVFRLESGGQS